MLYFPVFCDVRVLHVKCWIMCACIFFLHLLLFFLKFPTLFVLVCLCVSVDASERPTVTHTAVQPGPSQPGPGTSSQVSHGGIRVVAWYCDTQSRPDRSLSTWTRRLFSGQSQWNQGSSMVLYHTQLSRQVLLSLDQAPLLRSVTEESG